MGLTERKARQKESLRNVILDAARDILLGDGLAQFSMRRIAERIEYSPTTIYLYFKDKSDLLFHLCEEVYGKILETLQTAVAGESDPVARLRAAMLAYIQYGLGDPDRYRIAFMTTVDIEPGGFLKQGTLAMTTYEFFHREVCAVLKKIPGCPRNPETVTQVLWASVHGVVSLVISRPGFPWEDHVDLAETNIDLLVQGLLNYRRKI